MFVVMYNYTFPEETHAAFVYLISQNKLMLLQNVLLENIKFSVDN